MSDFFRLKRIDNRLQEIIDPVSFFDVNPFNLEQEKDLVLKDPDYNPYFIYPEYTIDFQEVQHALHEVEEHESPLGRILDLKRKIFIDKCEMLLNRGSDKFSIFAKKVYGLPSREVLDRSVSFLSLDSEHEPTEINSEMAVNMIQAEINHYGFQYSVHTKPMSASAMVLVAKKMICIKEKSNFSKNFIRRLIVHEIGTHVLRAENGKEQPFNIFFHGFPNYLSTEEGLAVVNEERFGLLNNSNLKNYAARAIAVQMAMRKSFSEIFNYLTEFFSPTTAFRITARAKRGIADTSKPGGCPKDHLYIDGYLKVKEFLEKGGNLNQLYLGKVGVEHLEHLGNLHTLSTPKFLPKNQTFKSLLSF